MTRIEMTSPSAAPFAPSKSLPRCWRTCRSADVSTALFLTFSKTCTMTQSISSTTTEAHQILECQEYPQAMYVPCRPCSQLSSAIGLVSVHHMNVSGGCHGRSVLHAVRNSTTTTQTFVLFQRFVDIVPNILCLSCSRLSTQHYDLHMT